MTICEKISGTTNISAFVEIYNNNNDKIEDEITAIKKRLSTLETNYNKKADRLTLTPLINKEVLRVLDTKYTSILSTDNLTTIDNLLLSRYGLKKTT